MYATGRLHRRSELRWPFISGKVAPAIVGAGGGFFMMSRGRASRPLETLPWLIEALSNVLSFR
jgi:hypothetical protein